MVHRESCKIASRQYSPGVWQHDIMVYHSVLIQVYILKLFDAEVIIYSEGFMQRSRMAEVQTQSLYYVEIKIIIDRVELKKGMT